MLLAQHREEAGEAFFASLRHELVARLGSKEETNGSQSEFVDVIDVRVLARYVLELTFSNGEVRVLDFEPHTWGPTFEPLKASYDLFLSVRVDAESGTVTWPTGADWDPDELYRLSKAAVPA